MKKYFSYAFAGAIALTGAVGFASCSTSGEDVVSNINQPDPNPSNNSEQEFVKTQFAISIPISGNQAGTRMHADGAPDNNVFKGIKGIRLYPISNNVDANRYATASSAISTPITLTDISESGLDQTGSGGNFHGKVYSDVAIPVGTKAFLFYGEITNENGGDLTPSYGTTGNPSNISFSLVPIQTKTFSEINTDEKGANVLAALNGIIGVLAAQEAAAAAVPHASATHLNELLQSFQSLKAGSANSVRTFVQNVYNQLTNIGTTYSATTYTDAVKNKIKEYFTEGGTNPNNTLSWTTPNTFPNNIGLPDGAIGLSCATNTFSFASVSGNQPELNTYVKPASLFYTVNTPIHTSTAAQVANYTSKSTWADVVALYSATEVSSATRGVVLDNPIQYGVGRLKSQVVLASTTLNANDADGHEVAVTNVPGAGFPVTGILIGSQKNVTWNFEPTGTATYTIYDPVQTGGASVKASTTASTANYTLALQTDKDEEVRVVVELENDADDFYGEANQLIPHGSKFYLAATLNPKAASGVTTYDENNNAKNRVFCQDVETIVNFTVGANSLKKAYNTIPDLRSPQMELGLSVDLTWNTGLTFDVTFP